MARDDGRRTEKTSVPGIFRRHRSGCAAKRCACPYTATVWSARDDKLIRRQFPEFGAAKSWREDARGAVRRGTMCAPTQRTVQEAAEEWLAGAREGTIRNRSGNAYKPSAIRGYERALRNRILPTLGHLRLSAVTRNHVQDLAERMLADDLAPSTVLNAVNPLQAIFRRAVKRGEVAVNPTVDLDLPRPDGRRDRIASPAEARRLLDALPDEQRALWATAFYAGLRRGELRALRWSDVDLDAGLLRVERGWDAKEGPIEAKSRAGRRRVPIARELRAHLAAHRLRSAALGDALVFGVSPISAFEPSTVRRRALKAWADASKAAAGRADRERRDPGPDEVLRPIGLHEARHTFASLMIAAGVNVKALSTYMGHASITITMDRYGHLLPGAEGEAADLLDAYLARVRT